MPAPQLAIIARDPEKAAKGWEQVDPGFTQYPLMVTSLAQLPNLRDIVVVVVSVPGSPGDWRYGYGSQHADIARMLDPERAATRGWTVWEVTV